MDLPHPNHLHPVPPSLVFRSYIIFKIPLYLGPREEKQDAVEQGHCFVVGEVHFPTRFLINVASRLKSL